MATSRFIPVISLYGPRLISAALLATMLLSACAENIQFNRAVHTIDATLVLRDESGLHPVVGYSAEDVFIWLPFISGDIYGRPNQKALFTFTLDANQQFHVDLKPYEQAVSAISREPEAEQSSVAVQPGDTRLARLATMVWDKASQQGLGATGWRDGDTGEYLILVYVNQACHIKGVVKSERLTTRVDAQLPSPGFHWLRIFETGDDERQVKSSPAPRHLQLFTNVTNAFAI